MKITKIIVIIIYSLVSIVLALNLPMFDFYYSSADYAPLAKMFCTSHWNCNFLESVCLGFV